MEDVYFKEGEYVTRLNSRHVSWEFQLTSALCVMS